MTTEYLLRLLSAVDGIDEDQVSSSPSICAKMAFAARCRGRGRSRLRRPYQRSPAAHIKLRYSAMDPLNRKIFDVEKRTSEDSDLPALAPQERESLSRFEDVFPERSPLT